MGSVRHKWQPEIPNFPCWQIPEMRALFAALLAIAACGQSTDAPFGVHIAYGEAGGDTSLTVMWSTRAPVSTSQVSVLRPTAFNTSGTTFPFSDSNNVQTMHRVYLSGLTPATTYTYTVGAVGGTTSPPFTFTTQPARTASWTPTIAIFGDMGISTNAKSTMPLLLADAAGGRLDAVVHIGDAAYDLQSNDGQVGDAFMEQIQPLGANVPYHICPVRFEANHTCAARPTRPPKTKPNPNSHPNPLPSLPSLLLLSLPPSLLLPSPLLLFFPLLSSPLLLLFLSFPQGNHENNHDFYQYRMRLGAAMPPAVGAPSGGGNGTFHSFNIGQLHVVLVSSEVYFSVQPHSAGLAFEQAVWLEADLKAVDRAVTPFVALGLHQPFYCSPNDDSDDCHQIASLVRIGLEKIIYEGGVDVVFQAHEHACTFQSPLRTKTTASPQR